MDSKQPSLTSLLEEIRRILQQPVSASAPNGHDILNALHTVLCSIEMMEMDITKPQRVVFDRLESGAKQLEELLQAYIVSSSKAKSAVLATIDAAMQAE